MEAISYTLSDLLSGVIFGSICHQDPDILVSLGGKVIPLCPRCMGLHGGFLWSLMVLSLFRTDRLTRSRGIFIVVIFLGLGSLLADWALGWFGILSPSTLSRLITGLMGGLALALLFTAYTRQLHGKFCVLHSGKARAAVSAGGIIFILAAVVSLLAVLPDLLIMLLAWVVVVNAVIALYTLSGRAVRWLRPHYPHLGRTT